MTDKEKEIVQALRCCAEGECKDCAMHEDKQRCQENLLGKAAEAIESLTAENAALREKVSQWVSVEDRLPEVWKDEDGVLVNYMIYTPEFGADIGNYHAKAKRWLCMAIPCTVTHWMPLPEAPERGGSNA
jgi:hypothetical protein